MKSTNANVPLRLAYWVLAALFAMNLLNYIDRYILNAVLGPVQESLGLVGQDKKAGSLTTVFMISYTLFSPLVGWFGDRMARKYLLAAGVGLWSIATFGSGLAATYGEMLFARSLLGVGEAAYATLAPTMIADLFTRGRRNRALSIFYVAIPLGAALGFLLGGWINEHHRELHFLPLLEDWAGALTGRHFTEEQGRGWRMAFFVVGLPGLAVAVAALFLPEPRRGATEDVDEEQRLLHEKLPLTWGVYASLLRNRSYIFNCLAMAMTTFALGGLQVWTARYLSADETKMKLKDADFGLGAVTALAGITGTLVGAWVCDRVARRRRDAYFWVSGLTQLMGVPFIMAAFLGPIVGFPYAVIFGCIFVGLFLSFMNYGPSNTIIVNVTNPKIRAAAFAVNILVIHLLGDIPSPIVIGAVSDFVRVGESATDIQQALFWGVIVTIPAMILCGVFFFLGARYQVADEEAVLKQLRS